MPNKKAAILVVDDDPAYPLLLRKIYERASIPGALTHFEDAESALSYLEERAGAPEVNGLPDLILLDINMPQISGFEFLRRLRENSLFQAIPVIMLSVSESPDDVSRSYHMGANAYITKPTGFKQIEGMLSALYEFWFRFARIT